MPFPEFPFPRVLAQEIPKLPRDKRGLAGRDLLLLPQPGLQL